MDRLACDRMFVTVIELGSFTAAARRLGVSSGQASKLVQRLEEELGVQLLTRSTRALSPTPAGQDYFERMRRVIEEIDAIDHEIRDAAAEPGGRIRLTVPITFGARVLAPVLTDFAARYPQIRLQVDFSDRLTGLVDEGFDLAVRVGAPRDSGLIARRLCPIRVGVVAAPGYLAQRGTPRSPADLAQHDCILDGNFANPAAWAFRDPATGRDSALPVTGRLQFASAEAVAEAAVRGAGLARGPDFVLGPLVQAGRLRPVLTEWEAEPILLHALYPAGRHLPARLRRLIDLLVEAFRVPPAAWSMIPSEGEEVFRQT
ncbi:LysR family transcriptional regulator [Frigidibacter sp. MR17.24]|uniref:LysR family transcriptional regulator n=1 Tax=Frigidibacter sp. MR17.24 TaxID=3127345 RepID=UPI003012F01F